jgi:hypothetical protein
MKKVIIFAVVLLSLQGCIKNPEVENRDRNGNLIYKSFYKIEDGKCYYFIEDNRYGLSKKAKLRAESEGFCN